MTGDGILTVHLRRNVRIIVAIGYISGILILILVAVILWLRLQIAWGRAMAGVRPVTADMATWAVRINVLRNI